jgi:hypothetical protein
MGGIGSTRWREHARRATVDEAPVRLRAQWFAATLGGDRRAAHGTIKFSSPLNVEFELDEDVNDRRLLEIRLVARSKTGRPLLSRYRVAMHAVQQPLGGRRWWFFCPQCRTRRQTLYADQETFRWNCRQCAGLAYTSQHLAPWKRVALRAEKLARKAKVRWDPDDIFLPSRPRGMHRRTFKRHRAALRSVQSELEADFYKWVRRRFGASVRKQFASELGRSELGP